MSRLSPWLYGIWIVAAIAIIVLSLLYFFGGITKPKLNSLNCSAQTVVGKWYAGKYNDPELKSLFEVCRDMVKNNEVGGHLSMLTFPSDTLEREEIACFVGFNFTDDIYEIPKGFTAFEIPSSECVSYTSNSKWFSPSAEQLTKDFADWSKSNNKKLANYHLERYYPDNSVLIFAFIVD